LAPEAQISLGCIGQEPTLSKDKVWMRVHAHVLWILVDREDD